LKEMKWKGGGGNGNWGSGGGTSGKGGKFPFRKKKAGVRGTTCPAHRVSENALNKKKESGKWGRGMGKNKNKSKKTHSNPRWEKDGEGRESLIIAADCASTHVRPCAPGEGEAQKTEGFLSHTR